MLKLKMRDIQSSARNTLINLERLVGMLSRWQDCKVRERHVHEEGEHPYHLSQGEKIWYIIVSE